MSFNFPHTNTTLRDLYMFSTIFLEYLYSTIAGHVVIWEVT